jgi:hypothetical protein
MPASPQRPSLSADLALASLRIAIVFVLPVLLIRERWRHHDDSQQPVSRPASGGGDTMLQRFLRLVLR